MIGPSESGFLIDGEPKCRREYTAALEEGPLVSVIVATRERTESLVECLDSLLHQEYPNFEIIVVDNAPDSPRTSQTLERLYGSLPNVCYVREDIPGLAQAHNRGLEVASGEIAAFTDDDVLADREWLGWVAAGFRRERKIGCVTGMIAPVELETAPQAWADQFGRFGKGFARRTFDLGRNRPDSVLFPYAVGMCGSGANMAFSVAALRSIGGFDPALGAGSKGAGADDLAAFFEIINAGYSVIYEPAAIIRHMHRRDYEGLARQAAGYGKGLTAYLTKTIVDRPSRVFGLAARVPLGIWYILGQNSPKNSSKAEGYPRQLSCIERRGMVQGPFAYLHSKLAVKMRTRRTSKASSLSTRGAARS
jgi:glycosyltransferase involved in cell wall biosynthesis